MGALANLGHTVCRTTIADILKAHGLEPACERNRKPTWAEFLRAHWDVLGATDFFSVEVWTPKGLVTYYVLFMIELSTRKIEISLQIPTLPSWRRWPAISSTAKTASFATSDT